MRIKCNWAGSSKLSKFYWTELPKVTAWPQQKLATRPGALCVGLILTMRQADFFAEEVTVKPPALNSPPPLLRRFYRQTKNHTAIHSIRDKIMLFTDGCAFLSAERERMGRTAPKIENQYVAAVAHCHK